ncbi:Translation initiation factor [Mactra antiquata]
MAASLSDAAKTCCMCFGPVKGRTYRSVSSDISIQQWGPIFTQLGAKLNGYLCNFCINKLNRVCRLEEDSKTKVQQILLEKEKLMGILSEMSGVKLSRTDSELTSTLPASTPKESKKRPVHVALTPNTVTPKSKRGLFVTPRKNVTPKVLKQKPCVVDKSMQTKTINSDFVVKVMVKSMENERTYIVHDKMQQKLIKVLVNKGTESAFCKHLSKKQAYRAAMTEVVKKQIVKEIQEVVKRRESLLRCSSNEMLFNFDWNTTYSSIEKKMPTLMSLLKCTVISKKKCSPHIVMAASILLYARNQTINLIQYILGIILDSSGLTKEGLNIVHQIGLTVSHTSIYNKKKDLIYKQEENIEKVVKSYVQKRLQKADVNELVNESDEPVPIEVLGDNLDVTVSPTKMTLDHQRLSLHWFLTMVKQRQVIFENSDLASDAMIQPDILTLSTNSWVPDHCQLEDLHKDMLFHIAHVLIKYIKPLEFLGSSYPEYIVHPYIEQTKQKSVILNCDLVDASENTSQGMIEILQQVHNLTVPHKEGTLIEKVVFGGDVLTNERAFSAQSAMQNNKSDFDKLMGVIHRPEGLHRQFNFLLVMF